MPEPFQTGLMLGIVWGSGVIAAYDARTGKRAFPPVITALLAIVYYGIVPVILVFLLLDIVVSGHLDLRGLVLIVLSFSGGAGIGVGISVLTRPRPRKDEP